MPRGVAFLLLLAFLADNPLAGILHALALVGFRAAILADLGGDLANDLLVDAGHDDFGRLRHSDRDAFGRLIDDIMAEAKRELQVLALHRRTVADAVDLELPLEAVLH